MQPEEERSNLHLFASIVPLTVLSGMIMYLAERFGYGVDALFLIEYSGHSIWAETAAYLVLTLSQLILDGKEFTPNEKMLLSMLSSLLIECLRLQSVFDAKDVFFIIITSYLLKNIDAQLLRVTKPLISYIENKYRENQ